jgi:hypothetical protein
LSSRSLQTDGRTNSGDVFYQHDYSNKDLFGCDISSGGGGGGGGGDNDTTTTWANMSAASLIGSSNVESIVVELRRALPASTNCR